MTEDERKQKGKKRWKIALCSTLAFVIVALCFLQAGSFYTQASRAFWYPDYAKEDISFLLKKETLSGEEYEKIYRQTGLTRLAVDDMRDTETGSERILSIQEVFFSDIQIKSRLFAPFTYIDEIEGTQIAPFCAVQDGDIFVSSTTRVSWWRYGHAAIVIDGETEQIAECIGPGVKSKIANIRINGKVADFLIFRPKASAEVRSKVADFVQREMIGLSYRFTTGILTKKYTEDISFSQCAHFVWYAYKKFGIDLDVNGGGLVKPQDMALSPQVELVQAFGFNLDELWSA